MAAIAAYFAVGLDLEKCIPNLVGRLVTGNGRRKDHCTSIGLANPLGPRVLPMQCAKLGITFAGIEKLFLAIHLNDGDIVIQLAPIKIIGEEKITIAVGHDPDPPAQKTVSAAENDLLKAGDKGFFALLYDETGVVYNQILTLSLTSLEPKGMIGAE